MHYSPLTRAIDYTFRRSLPEVLGAAFEQRTEQMEMAAAVAAAIEEKKIVVVEAETGLGKSIAYLTPLVLFCERSGGRAVVSTYTKNLQRQLIEKDFPLARRATGANVAGAVLMGRPNYACRRRIDSILAGDGETPGRRAAGDTEGRALDPVLYGWLRAVLDDTTGEIDAMPEASAFLDANLRKKISCPSRDAVCAGCGFRENCFMLGARRRALDAQVVITNHALLFSDIAASGALLGPRDVLVVDEAHHLEDVATDFFTISYSPRSVRGAHESVYTPEYNETVRYVRTMIAGDSAEAADAIDESWATFLDSVASADEKTAELFALLGKNVARSSHPTNELRGSNIGDREAERAQVVYSEGAPMFYGAEAAAADVSRALRRMETAAGEIVEIVEECEALAETGAGGAMRSIRDAAADTHAVFDFLLSGSAEDHVFYARLHSPPGAPGGERERAVSALSASPVEVSARLGAVLEEGSRSSVLTSATLAVEGDFAFTLERLGLDRSRRTDTIRYESPFDLDAYRAVLLADYMPDPAEASFVGEAASVIGDVVAACRRRALVLCTARGQVAALGRLLAKSQTAGGELFVQTDGTSREDLLARFRKSRHGVLVGLASFWEGVDLPGNELELLVVLKLPFLVPTEPVTQARSRRITEGGDNAFEKLFLPDVVLKLKQGMGRLIRTGRDRGAVLLLDRRLGHSRYGEFVLRAVANRVVRCGGREETVERLRRYFSDQ